LEARRGRLGQIGRTCRQKVHRSPTHSAEQPRNGWGTEVYSKSENALDRDAVGGVAAGPLPEGAFEGVEG
jgi:hypothetical protein